MIKIGVLALQGALEEHLAILDNLGITGVRIRNAQELKEVQGLIIPGGESTVFGLMGRKFNLFESLQVEIRKGLPVWGTCAGMIFLCKSVANSARTQDTLGLLEAKAVRNGFGRQVDSFIKNLDFPKMGIKKYPAFFIRAPYLQNCSDNVEVLATYDNKVIACKQDNIFVTSFHPELTKKSDFHKYFIDNFVCK